MLNRCGENVANCLVPNLSGKALSFLPLSIMLAAGLLYMTFITFEIRSLHTHFGESFHQEWTLSFITCFFCIC